ncbi:MAG TPA: response regulator [Acidobacteriaceae bacterium]|nr:response regulator [Acidobacteriaceae bacterium]
MVEDDLTIAETLSLIFGHHGYEVRMVLSAERAMDLIDQWIPGFALIDVCLPEMNGIDFAIRLRAVCPECRILLFSGRPESGELLAVAASQGHHFEIIAKPVYPEVLLDRIAELLAAPRT